MGNLSELQSTDNQNNKSDCISLVLVNGPDSSVQAPRARAIFDSKPLIHFKSQGRFKSIIPAWESLKQVQNGTVYCIDLGFPQAALSAISWMPSLCRLYSCVSRCMAAGEPVLLVGDTGAGKTTVCQLVAFLRAQIGRAHV